jgi:opacity protein-like surface antigen
MFKHSLTALAMAAAAGLTTLPAVAQSRASPASPPTSDWGRYIGAGVGDSDLDTALRVFGGAAINQTFGWEVQYYDFGASSNRGVTTEAWALGGSVLAQVPLIPNLSAFGKLGAYYVKDEVTAPFSRASDSNVELAVGLGVRYALTPTISVRAEFESIGGAGGDVLSVAAQFRF